MFWDQVAGVYDIFVGFINKETHAKLRKIIADLIGREDTVLECACGTGMLSVVIASKCKKLTATDFSGRMINKARKNCVRFSNITFQKASITSLPYADESFDKVVAGNVIHLLDQPLAALKELDRVCKTNGLLIIPTYVNKNKGNKTNGFVRTVGKAGADFKREFTSTTYKQFFEEAGYSDVTIEEAEGRIPCAVAIMKKKGK